MNREEKDSEETHLCDGNAGRKLTSCGPKSCCNIGYTEMDVSGRRTESERFLLGTGGVMSAKAVPFNYLHFKKGDGGTAEKSTDEDKRFVLFLKK